MIQYGTRADAFYHSPATNKPIDPTGQQVGVVPHIRFSLVTYNLCDGVVMEYPEYITKTEAVKLIAQRICCNPKNSAELRTEKNKVNGRVTTAIDKKEIATNQTKSLYFFDVSKFAKQKFPSKFDDWPSPPDIATINCSFLKFGMSARFYSEPETIEECHLHIKELSYKLFQAWDKISELEAEIERLKPDAEKWLDRKAKSGRRPK